MTRRPPRSPLFPPTPLSRSEQPEQRAAGGDCPADIRSLEVEQGHADVPAAILLADEILRRDAHVVEEHLVEIMIAAHIEDRKSTRLNSSHANISYAVFCLKK